MFESKDFGFLLMEDPCGMDDLFPLERAYVD